MKQGGRFWDVRDVPCRSPDSQRPRQKSYPPPAVENAKGKLLAPNTTTGPNGVKNLRKSGFAAGVRVGSPWSMVASTHEPSSTRLANNLICPQVRPSSPVILPSGRLDSWEASGINWAFSDARPSAIFLRKAAFSFPGTFL